MQPYLTQSSGLRLRPSVSWARTQPQEPRRADRNTLKSGSLLCSVRKNPLYIAWEENSFDQHVRPAIGPVRFARPGSLSGGGKSAETRRIPFNNFLTGELPPPLRFLQRSLRCVLELWQHPEPVLGAARQRYFIVGELQRVVRDDNQTSAHAQEAADRDYGEWLLAVGAHRRSSILPMVSPASLTTLLPTTLVER